MTLSKLTLTNSIIEVNSATTQGGAINLNAVNADIVSTLIADNYTEEGLTVGGGISINSGDTTQVYVSIINATIADNYGSFLAGIAHFTGEIEGFSELTLQNTILANEIGGDNYTLEGGTPTLISSGGNLSSDDTTEDAFTAMNDALGEDPGFEGGGSYELAVGSAAINTGVAMGAPTTDILGNSRVGTVDKGAYENQIVSAVEDIAASAALHLYPNPTVSETLYVALGEAFEDNVTVRIVDVQGQLMQTTAVSKGNTVQTAQVDVSGLPAGYYILTADDGSGQGTKRFIKAE